MSFEILGDVDVVGIAPQIGMWRQNVTHKNLWRSLMMVMLLSTSLSAGCTKKNSSPSAPPAAGPSVPKEPTELDAQGGTPAQEPVTEAGVARDKAPRDVVVYYDPSGLTPEQLFEASQKLGIPALDVESDIRGADAQPLFYTGASVDQLRELLRVRMAAEEAQSTPEQREANRQLARDIGVAGFDVDWNRRRASLRFHLQGQNGPIEMRGRVDANMSFRVGRAEVWPHIEAEAQCVDLSGGCRNVVVKVREAMQGGAVRTAYIIARQTKAVLTFEGQTPHATRQTGADRWMRMAIHSEQGSGDERMIQANLATSETVGGASSFGLSMRVRRAGSDELIGISGPLVAPRGSMDLNIGLNLSPTVTTIDGRVVQVEGRLVDTLREVRLVRNDSRGNLQLVIVPQGADAQVAAEVIRVTVARQQVPTRGL